MTYYELNDVPLSKKKIYRYLGEDELQIWLEKCSSLRPLDFNSKYLFNQNIRNRNKNRYLPISIQKLSSENVELYNIMLLVIC